MTQKKRFFFNLATNLIYLYNVMWIYPWSKLPPVEISLPSPSNCTSSYATNWYT